MSRLAFTTMPGLESVAADELREHGLDAEREGPGLLLASVDPDRVPERARRCNRTLRCVGRIGVLLGEGDVRTLEDAEGWAVGLDFARWFGPPARFAVRARRYGEHDFHRPDLERHVGSAVQASFQAVGRKPPDVDLDDPDALVRVRLDGERIRIWLDTTGYRGLHVRAYRRYAHMASMKPTVANLLLQLVGWTGEGTLLDPFCGSATIPIEAAFRAAGVAPARLRGEPWIWERLETLAGASPPSDDPAGGEPGIDPERTRIVGLDRFAGHLQGGAENAAAAGVLDTMVLAPARAQQADRILADMKVAESAREPLLVATNPPFGRRVGHRSETANLYREAAAAWARADASRVATIAEHGELMEAALESAGFRIERRLPADYGAIGVTVFLGVRG